MLAQQYNVDHRSFGGDHYSGTALDESPRSVDPQCSTISADHRHDHWKPPPLQLLGLPASMTIVFSNAELVAAPFQKLSGSNVAHFINTTDHQGDKSSLCRRT